MKDAPKDVPKGDPAPVPHVPTEKPIVPPPVYIPPPPPAPVGPRCQFGG